MRHSSTIVVRLVAVLALLSVSACDLIFPPPLGIEDQVRYLPLARQSAQALERWWPLLMPTAPKGAAMGTPAFALPASYDAALTADPLHWPGFSRAPTEARCSKICVVRWSGDRDGWPWSMWAIIDPDTGVREAGETVTTTPWGTWRLAFGLGGDLDNVRLEDIGFGPLTSWVIDCDDVGVCRLGVAHRDGPVATGVREPNGDWTFDLLPGAWLSGAPWRGTPRRLAHGGRPWRLEVEYANGLTSAREVDLEAGRWRQSGPGQIAWTGQRAGNVWTIQGVFAADQVLYRVETTASIGADGLATNLHEWRTDTRARRVETRLRVDRDGNLTALDWLTSGWSGRVQLREAAPGWRVEGFLATPAGDLVSFAGWRYATGLVALTYGGWRPEDPNQPFEDGDFVLLPDGSARSRLRLRQTDESYAEIEAWSPPEGVSPLSLD